MTQKLRYPEFDLQLEYVVAWNPDVTDELVEAITAEFDAISGVQTNDWEIELYVSLSHTELGQMIDMIKKHAEWFTKIEIIRAYHFPEGSLAEANDSDVPEDFDLQRHRPITGNA